jgi:hypothetical protein
MELPTDMAVAPNATAQSGVAVVNPKNKKKQKLPLFWLWS